MTDGAGLVIRGASAGRALRVRPDGTLYIGRGYAVYRSTDDGDTWSFVTRIPCGFSGRLAGLTRISARLFRHEIRALNVLSDGSLVASTRRGVFYAESGSPQMRPAAIEEGGQPVYPPMTITVGPGDRVLWGEYDSRTAHGKPVRIYVSDDRGRSFQIARVFPGGSILHVHNIVPDASRGHYWLLAGDHNHEPGIGILSADLKSFEWLVKGEQIHRAVEVSDFGDRLIYATDSEKASNHLVSLEKNTGRVEKLRDFEGSCIYACRFGSILALSTTVEPSAVNTATHAALYVSRDGLDWQRVLTARKDRHHPVYFQYGSIVLPRGESGRETLCFSGQAVEGLDGQTLTATLAAHRAETGHAASRSFPAAVPPR